MATRTLPVGVVHLWRFDTDAPVSWESVLDASEKRRALRFRQAQDATRFRTRRAIRRRILAEYTGVDAATLAFETRCEHCGGDHGRPRLTGGPEFNASHAAGLGVLAVCAHRIGVDVEHPARAPDPHDHAGVLAPGERARVSDAGPDAQRRFLEAWSAKEAYLKMEGLGLARDLSGLDTSTWGDLVPRPERPGSRFQLLRHRMGDAEVAVAVVAEGPIQIVHRIWPDVHDTA